MRRMGFALLISSLLAAPAAAQTDIFNMTDTWNNGATDFTSIRMDVTDSASLSSSKFLDLLIGGVSVFNIRKDGQHNWNAGDLLLTPTSNLLTLSGGDLAVPTEVYDAGGWNGDLTVPTKDAVRDKIESLVSGTPGGADTQVQFNDGGAFGGDSGLLFVKTTDRLTVGTGAAGSGVIVSPYTLGSTYSVHGGL